MSIDRIVFSSIATGVWGAEQSMLTLAASLREQGHNVALVCTDRAVAEAWHEATSSDAILIDARVNEGRASLVRDFWRELRRICTGNDVLVLFSYVLSAGVLFPRRWSRGRPHIVLDLHDTLTAGFGRFALNICALRIHRVVAVSEYTGAQIVLRKRICRVLTRPVRPLAFTLPSTASENMRVGVVGRVAPEKNIALAIDGVARTDAVDLIVRGPVARNDETFAENIRLRGRQLLGRRFYFEGPRPWSTALSGLDVVIVANSAEPMGRTVLEAQLSGVIALVPDQGGSSELIDHGATGVRYRANDPDSLAQQIDLLRSADVSAIAIRARDHAVVLTDPNSYARRYLAAITS
ncbi:glycosyltransferase family 4 protein [Microbacterium sp. ZW T5_45]|uniref:glycosyltransferase family 4 protein n=1 Tax=Microbacterium sp. ZW T5_45 TaxID=3378080 RepID=UPI003854647F